MTSTPLERRMAENEVVFRKHNERLMKWANSYNAIAKKEGHHAGTLDKNTLLEFFCECADENCVERVKETASKYKKIHQSKDTFIIKPGHNVISIEKVIHKESDYHIVEKFEVPASTAEKLSKTPINNT